MYRKQVRRRRAVLALLIISSFVLLTITYGQGSNGLQRGVSTVFSPLQGVANRALSRPATWSTGSTRPSTRAGKTAASSQNWRGNASGRSPARRRWQENAQLRKLLELDRAGVASGYKPVTGSVIARSPTVW